MKQLAEQIKPIKRYEGLYELSNYGYVISLAKSWEVGIGLIRHKPLTILKSQISNSGYHQIRLHKNGSAKTYQIYQLVWDHFGNKPRNGRTLQVDHIDNNRLHSWISNLQLLSQRENISKGCRTRKKTSQYVGVNWNKEKKKWRSEIYSNKKHHHLGYFINEIDAYNAYQEALKKLEEKCQKK